MLADARRQFLEDYGRIRSAEGRGSDQSAYFRALPFTDVTGRNPDQWRIRARTFTLRPSRSIGQRLKILDLGRGIAGCPTGWRNYVIDRWRSIFLDQRDGLRAARHYPVSIPVVEGDFDRLPFSDSGFDLVVFNASFHYSSDYARTLAEARRCLRPEGRVVILDSPVYELSQHGEQMRAERQRFFEQEHGFRSEALRSIESWMSQCW